MERRKYPFKIYFGFCSCVTRQLLFLYWVEVGRQLYNVDIRLLDRDKIRCHHHIRNGDILLTTFNTLLDALTLFRILKSVASF